jgi:isoleucyl-tRNA synthetase
VAAGEQFALLEKHAAGLKEILNVSAVGVVQGSLENVLEVTVKPASGHKCARCWNFMPHVSNYGVWENVCDRCQGALNEMGIQPPQPAGAPA